MENTIIKNGKKYLKNKNGTLVRVKKDWNGLEYVEINNRCFYV